MTETTITKTAGTVLVVDDVDMNCSLVQSILEVHGYEVQLAQRGSDELLARIFAAPPDLIILDVMMPGINGLVMCQRLRADPRSAGIPIIIVTSLTDRTVRMRAIAAGANHVMLKPIDTQELHITVRNAVSAKRELDSLRAAHGRLTAIEGRRRSWMGAFLESLAEPVHTLCSGVGALSAQAGGSSPGLAHLHQQALLIAEQLEAANATNDVHAEMRSLVLERLKLRTLIEVARLRLLEVRPGLQVIVDVPDSELTCDRRSMQKALTTLVTHIGHGAARNVLIQGQEKAQGTQLTIVADVVGQNPLEIVATAQQSQTTAITIANPFRDVRLAFCAFVVDAHGGTLRGDRVKQSERVKLFLPDQPGDGEPL